MSVSMLAPWCGTAYSLYHDIESGFWCGIRCSLAGMASIPFTFQYTRTPFASYLVRWRVNYPTSLEWHVRGERAFCACIALHGVAQIRVWTRSFLLSDLIQLVLTGVVVFRISCISGSWTYAVGMPGCNSHLWLHYWCDHSTKDWYRWWQEILGVFHLL